MVGEVRVDADNPKTLVLGLGNVIMGDEGVGVHVVRALEKQSLPPGVECLDGGTGGFILLEPLQQADRIILIDATQDENPIGTITRTTPQFSKDYPPTLTAHDIGVKDLLDAFYIQGGNRDVILYAITIDPLQSISMELSEQCQQARDVAVQRIQAELCPQKSAATHLL
ncbi:MAG TPA: hydrogenase maturation protease [Terracidiphilus sp.]|jgi:hydrogenase maturation protease|nr:hydrogenase maturation protease [Terracidiphilus sp.]